MTVQELIDELKKFPPDHQVCIHEYQGIYDLNPFKVTIMDYDKKRDNKTVTIKAR